MTTNDSIWIHRFALVFCKWTLLMIGLQLLFDKDSIAVFVFPIWAFKTKMFKRRSAWLKVVHNNQQDKLIHQQQNIACGSIWSDLIVFSIYIFSTTTSFIHIDLMPANVMSRDILLISWLSTLICGISWHIKVYTHIHTHHHIVWMRYQGCCAGCGNCHTFASHYFPPAHSVFDRRF